MSAARVEVGPATRADDPALRALVGRLVIPGDVTVTFEREPDFFDACSIHGDVQVGVGRDTGSGAVIGLGTRSIASAFVNGRPRDIGYLADLRLEPPYRNGTLVARGYRLLRRMHADGRVEFYTTVIFASNRVALDTIATGRAGLPRYHDFGVVHCPAINVGAGFWRPAGGRAARDAALEIRPGRAGLLDDIVDCLNRNNARRQFAPVHTARDFEPGGRWKGFAVADFRVAFRCGRVVGVVGVWDQRAFKQTRIVRYAPHLGAARPIVNAIRRVTGGPRYARAGEYLRYACVAFIAIDENDPGVFRALLRAAYEDQAGRDRVYLMIALHERDPFLPLVQRDYTLTPFQARLFCVSFAEGEAAVGAIDARTPHIEAALL